MADRRRSPDPREAGPAQEPEQSVEQTFEQELAQSERRLLREWTRIAINMYGGARPTEAELRIAGKCMDVANSGTANNTKIQLFDCNGSGAQQWYWNSASKSLMNPQSQRCLDDPSSSTIDGTQLQLFDCNLTAAQQWTLP